MVPAASTHTDFISRFDPGWWAGEEQGRARVPPLRHFFWGILGHMAGYSGTPLAKKIGIKDEHVVFLDGAPEDLPLDTGAASVVRRFPRRSTSPSPSTRRTPPWRAAADAVRAHTTAGMVWVCWPKKAAQKALGIASDLDDGRSAPSASSSGSWTSRWRRSTTRGRV